MFNFFLKVKIFSDQSRGETALSLLLEENKLEITYTTFVQYLQNSIKIVKRPVSQNIVFIVGKTYARTRCVK